ncbi:MAG: elongation factor P [Candidatus Niyogibacteria bacterium]|nr:elongation factor P [Candidatus Niyogibacteria bacterium]
MLSYSDLKRGVTFRYEGEPYQVVGSDFLRMQMRKPVMQVRMKNLKNGRVIERNFHQNESFEEIEVERSPMVFLYGHRGQFTFHPPGKPAERTILTEDVIGEGAKYLKSDLSVEFKKIGDEVIGIEIPIKVDYGVKEAPPTEKGNTAQGGTKEVVLENGLALQVPFFINAGDVVRLNTETGEYIERVEKQK